MSTILKIAKFIDSNFEDLKRKVINHLISEYGHINTLDINNTNKTISLKLKLHGDTTDTSIDIKKYKIVSKDKQTTSIVIEQATCDKQWIDKALNQFVVGKSFDIPVQDKYGLIDELL
jgi:hypothetical protein